MFENINKSRKTIICWWATIDFWKKSTLEKVFDGNHGFWKIRNQIIKGCKKFAVNIGNRKKAINTGIKELRSNEILLIAGKGHEKTQTIGTETLPFDDFSVVKNTFKSF